jgi:sugar/nucleoside kinase (ribokinase family)
MPPAADGSAVRVAVIGDCLLDVTVVPSRPIRSGSDIPASIHVGPGGQAANVAVRLARRGISARLIAPLGDDPAGELLRGWLEGDGVALAALPARRTGSVIALLDAAGERTMLSSRVELETAAVGQRLSDVQWIHCSGYAVVDDVTGEELARLLSAVDGRPVSVAGGSVPPEPGLAARVRDRLAHIHPRLLVLNREEASAVIGGPHSPPEAAEALAPYSELPIVTAGADGAVAWLHGSVVSQPAADASSPMTDSTGAGDAYAAALIAELAVAASGSTDAELNWPPAEAALRAAMTRAARLAAKVARVVGAQARVAGEPAARRRLPQ